MKRYRLKFISFTLLFYLLSSFLSATHIHNDEHVSHNDCKICIVVKNLHSADAPNIATLPLIDAIHYQKIAIYHSLFVRAIEKGFDAHAPPLFS